MNSEERIARLERLTKLFARAGRRERRRIGTVEEKIDIIIDFQIANEERFATLTETIRQLAEQGNQTQRRLDALIEAIERDRNGHSS
jgi:uncharacterized protein YigA (DUF484 family)